jgi:carbon monoxide dehydrogenase subunit G
MLDVQYVSIFIACSPSKVYQFASNPENLPRWAAGLTSTELSQDGDVWIAQAPFGRVKIRFAAQNPFGVMDHDVELESGMVVNNPMRVVSNGDGSELAFTLFRRETMSDQEYAADIAAVEADLQTLKHILEVS